MTRLRRLREGGGVNKESVMSNENGKEGTGLEDGSGDIDTRLV
jgi:hypothetical protein